jgi:hypothetical protein
LKPAKFFVKAQAIDSEGKPVDHITMTPPLATMELAEEFKAWLSTPIGQKLKYSTEFYFYDRHKNTDEIVFRAFETTLY